MTIYRDIKLKQKDKLDDKQDRLLFKRAVLTTEGGLQTSTDPFNDVWASASERRAWYMTDGAVQPAQVLCRKVSDPYVGLGVIIGYADGSNQLEVLSDDFFLTKTGDPTGWASTSPRDFEPGGRKQMWVYTKVITPLATYPGSGIKVNVISGDYPYLGTRKSYAGSVNYDLSASVPAAGLCRYAGLYLDASNTLQTINGSTAAAGSTPPEPSWPAGAFRLCVVLLTNGDTSIDFANILDRRMAWSDQQSGPAKVWPFAHVLTVSTTDTDADYPTVAAAIAAAAAGDAILLEMETSSETITVNKAVTIIGWSRAGTIFTNPITITSAATLVNVKVSIAAGTNSKGFIISANTTLYNCEGVTAGSTTSRAVEISAGTTYIVQGYYESTGAGTSNEVFVSGGGAILEDPILSGGNVSGSIQGTYRNSLGYVTIAALTQLRFVSTASQTGGVWLVDESALLKTKEATLAAAIAASASGDSIKLDTDTYSVSASQNIDTSITIEGDGPEATIYTTSVSNATAFDITTDSITVVFKDLTIRHTGGGVAATGIFSNNASVTVVLDNAVLEISSGAGTTSRGLWIESGTWILRNGAKIVVTSGTSKYGIYNDAGAATITIGAGCEVGGATADIYGDQTGSTLTNFGLLTNGIVDFAGISARGNIQVAPTPPILINGHPLIWQRGTSFAAAADATYFADHFSYHKVGAMVHTLSRDTDVPTVASIGVLLDYSMLVDCTTVDASIAAGDFCIVRTVIEGHDFLKIAQQQFTLPFWVKATKTGIYCISFRNSGNDRSYVVEYTVNTADTWEYKQVTVIASPTAGTWDYTTGAGVYISWALACGSTFQTTAGAWQTGQFYGTSNQVNACDNTANNFRLIVGEPIPGAYARPIVANPYGAFNVLMTACQRYFRKSYNYAVAPGTISAPGFIVFQTRTAIAASVAGNQWSGFSNWQIPMVTTPTMVLYSNATGTAAAIRNNTTNQDRTGATANNVGVSGFGGISISNASANAIALDDLMSFQFTAAAEY